VNPEVTLSMLKDLIETSREGERGFALAAKDNREPDVTEVLKDGEESCRAAAVELQDQARMLGGASGASETGKAPVHRGWVNFKAVAISRDTKSILEECERGEDYARRRYEDAMKSDLPESVRASVERQYQSLIAIHGRVRQLRNRYSSTEVPRAMGSRSDDRS
jgi:uncharacterized protein (TIGR02284 family)